MIYRSKSLFFILFLNLFFMQISLAEESILADSEWLESHINDENLRILEVRHDPHRYYTVGHIEGAIQVQRFNHLVNRSGTSPFLRYPDKEQFQETLRDFGVNNDSQILIYGDSRTVMASRVYYLLDLYDFDMKHVKILNGGTIEWAAFDSSQDFSIKS